MLTKEQNNKHAYNLIYSDLIDRDLYIEFIKAFLNNNTLPNCDNVIVQLLINKINELGWEYRIDKLNDNTMEVFVQDYNFYGFYGFESSNLLEAFTSTLIFLEFNRFSDLQDYSNIDLNEAEILEQEASLFTKFLVKYINKE